MQVVLTKLHAGGKFGGGGYKISGGLHGVGLSVVNALSEWLKVEVYQDGKHFSQTYKRGIPQEELKVSMDRITSQFGGKNIAEPETKFMARVQVYTWTVCSPNSFLFLLFV